MSRVDNLEISLYISYSIVEDLGSYRFLSSKFRSASCTKVITELLPRPSRKSLDLL